MGYGFPAAIGAQFAQPETRSVWAVVGDGGFQMTLCELATAQIHQASPLKCLVINNNFLGMVRQWQEMFFENRLSGVDLEGNPGFREAGRSLRREGPAHPARRPTSIACSQEAQAYRGGPLRRGRRSGEGRQRLPDDPGGRRAQRTCSSNPRRTKLEKPTGST